MLKRSSAVAAVVSALVAGPAAGSTLEYTDLYVFGDSLADVGRAFSLTGGTIPPTPPYFEGQFTGPDGPVWAGIVGDAFLSEGKDVSNYAVGGAEALGTGPTDMPAQLAEFGFGVLSGAVTPGADALAAFWYGANDIFAALPAGVGVPVARQAADAIALAATSLSAVGIDSYVFFTLGDFSDLPAFSGGPLAASAQAGSQAFDARLKSNVAVLQTLGFDATLVDTGALFRAALDAPSAFGFENTADACVIRQGTSILFDCTVVPGPDASRFLWFDTVHPGSRAHAFVADAVLDEIAPIAPIPGPAALPLALTGIGLAFVVGRAGRRPAGR